MNESENIGIFNPAKEIAREIILQALINHRDGMLQCREGKTIADDQFNLSDDTKKLNKVKGLNKVISAQEDLITNSRAVVNHRCFVLWKRKNPTMQEQDENKFEEEDNDYNRLILYKEMLKAAKRDIIKAEQTKTKDDDYLVEKQTNEGIKYILTPKFFEMVEGLEDLYEKIYLIMLKHKIVSSGIEEDEEKTDKELEKEAIERIVEA